MYAVKVSFYLNYNKNQSLFRKCPHYILDNVDLFAGYEPAILNEMAKLAWNTVRLLIIGKVDAL
jgi:hypothetical protein